MKILPVILIFQLLLSCAPSEKKQEADPPNIIILYADDMGYGDLAGRGV